MDRSQKAAIETTEGTKKKAVIIGTIGMGKGNEIFNNKTIRTH